ncbi:fumarylacetoacetate hydrolase family protein [Cupriavidus basilensis]
MKKLLALIRSKSGRNIAPERACHHIWGYTIDNDVTACDRSATH